mmetsp:Transcript_5892/g.18619  ORF Transcript_5892/g.18619 Transcript_5892/m.18619 type:complete len:205 (-) Transcript_5892:501-1115(-)
MLRFQYPTCSSRPTVSAAACNVGVDIPEVNNTSMAKFTRCSWPNSSNSHKMFSLSDSTEDFASRKSPVYSLRKLQASSALCRLHKRSTSAMAAVTQSAIAFQSSTLPVSPPGPQIYPTHIPPNTAATCVTTCIARGGRRKDWSMTQNKTKSTIKRKARFGIGPESEHKKDEAMAVTKLKARSKHTRLNAPFSGGVATKMNFDSE